MNLVEHYIRRIISATDISDRYEEGMKKYDPNYELKEPMYEVKLEYDCYGHIGVDQHIIICHFQRNK